MIAKNKIIEIFRETIEVYRLLFDIDLSYMQIKISSANEYADGTPCYDFKPDEWAGTHVKNGYIIINPDLHLTLDRYNLDCSVEDFTKQIIAHELAHEIWFNENLADESFKAQILLNAVDSNFHTVYLDTVKPEKLPEETFCEYLSDYVFRNGKL